MKPVAKNSTRTSSACASCLQSSSLRLVFSLCAALLVVTPQVFAQLNAVENPGDSVVIFSEDFSDGSDLYTKVSGRSLYDRKRSSTNWRSRLADYTRTWSVSNKLGPGQGASVPPAVSPAVFTGNDGSYFVGRLNSSRAILRTLSPIDVSGHTGLKARVRLAAAGAMSNTASRDYQNNFSRNDHLYLYLTYNVSGRHRVALLDAFRGGNPLKEEGYSTQESPLQSRKTGNSISTVFTVHEWDLDPFFGDDVDEVEDLRLYVSARTNQQFIGIDAFEILADPVAYDECPLDPAKTEAGICGCGVPDDTPLCLFNGDFQTGDLDNWEADTSSGGTVEVVSAGAESGNYAALLTTGSPVSLSIKLNTPAESFYLLFDSRFRTQSGSLRVTLSGSEVVTVNGNEESGSNFTTKQVLVTAAELQGLTGATLEFTFDGESDSELFLDNVVIIPATAGELCVIGGDNIGDDNSTVNGNNAISARGGSWGNDGANLGFSAIPFSSDGVATLYDFRIIATVVSSNANDSNGNIDWSGQNWTFGVFHKDDFLAEGEPLLSYSFGATPDNWSGFRRINDLRNVPDTEPFGNFSSTGERAGELYELRFNLSNVIDGVKGALFAEPLPVGEYFLAVQSHASHKSFGEAGLAVTRSTIHPSYWHDSNTMSPQPIVPNMTSDTNVGVAFSVRMSALSCQ